MVHPLFTVLINRPELIVDHAAGYAALVREEAAGYGHEALSRAIAWGVAVLALGAFLILAGVAAMLAALHSQFHWALLAVPGASLALAVAAWVHARKPMASTHFHELKAQIDADAQALRHAGGRA